MRKENRFNKIQILYFIIQCLVVFFFCNASIKTYAMEQMNTWDNTKTGYCAMIEDDANLLDEEERLILLEDMKSITEHGNVLFKTISENNMQTSDYASFYYKQLFGQQSGTIFLIDMDHRNIYIFSDGDIYKVVTNAYADTITDNVYKYASEADYYNCAMEAFSQINKLLKGKRISQPMKYISNLFIAFTIAFLVNFILAILLSKAWRTNNKELLSMAKHEFKHTDDHARFISVSKEYSPIITGGGGGSGGSGGGSSSGGGGGHSF